MSRRPRTSFRRGLTLIELMLALTVTVMVAGAMSGMMTAVSAGVMDRQDSRGLLIRTSAAQTKLAAYVCPARAIWGTTSTMVAIWLNDNRQSDTMHISEVRWLVFDSAAGTLEMHFLKLPDDWTDIARDMVDKELSTSDDFVEVHDKYVQSDHIASIRLLDGLEAFSVELDDSDPLEATHVTFRLTFTGSDGPFVTTVPVTIAHHQSPVS